MPKSASGRNDASVLVGPPSYAPTTIFLSLFLFYCHDLTLTLPTDPHNVNLSSAPALAPISPKPLRPGPQMPGRTC